MLATVDDLQAYIEAHQIQARLYRNIGYTPTVPAAAKAVGVHPDQIVKTLLFVVERPGEDAAPSPCIVVISHGERLVERRALADHFNVGRKRVKLASPELVLAQLGYPAGGVPPFGHRTSLPVLLDASIINLPQNLPGMTGERIFAGGGDDQTMLELTISELLRVTRPKILPLSRS